MSSTNSETTSRTNRSTLHLAGSVIVSSAIIFFLLNTLSEGLYPNYSVASQALSDLGAIGSKTFLLWNGQLFVFGMLVLLGMYLLFYKSELRQNIRRASQVGVLYLLPGVGVVIVSLFPENSALGVLGVHALGAFIAFAFGGIAAIYSYRLTKGPIRYFSVMLGIITLVFIPVFVLSPSSIAGLTERFVAYPEILWLLCFGTFWIASDHS